MTKFELVKWIVSVLVPALAGFTGVLVGAWLTAKREKAQRRHEFLVDQLKHFYSPLLGIRSEIQLRGEIREEISRAADSVWRDLYEHAGRGGFERQQELSDERSDDFGKMIHYDNAQLREELLPAYREMLTIFRDHMWLAEPETRRQFGELVRFIDIWDRWIAGSLPSEVLTELRHSEADLQPFYAHIEEKHDQLRLQLAQGDQKAQGSTATAPQARSSRGR
jgi:hypothetical protein